MIYFLTFLHQVLASGVIPEFIKDPDGIRSLESDVRADMETELDAKVFPRRKRGLFKYPSFY